MKPLLLLLTVTFTSSLCASTSPAMLINIISSPEVSSFLEGFKDYDLKFSESSVGNIKTFKLKVIVKRALPHGGHSTCSVEYLKEVTFRNTGVAQTTKPIRLNPIQCDF